MLPQHSFPRVWLSSIIYHSNRERAFGSNYRSVSRNLTSWCRELEPCGTASSYCEAPYLVSQNHFNFRSLQKSFSELLFNFGLKIVHQDGCIQVLDRGVFTQKYRFLPPYIVEDIRRTVRSFFVGEASLMTSDISAIEIYFGGASLETMPTSQIHYWASCIILPPATLKPVHFGGPDPNHYTLRPFTKPTTKAIMFRGSIYPSRQASVWGRCCSRGWGGEVRGPPNCKGWVSSKRPPPSPQRKGGSTVSPLPMQRERERLIEWLVWQDQKAWTKESWYTHT